MIRQPEAERLQRLSIKTIDQVFIKRAQEGLSCSLFEAQALTDLVRDVYFPYLAQPQALQAGQWAIIAVSALKKAARSMVLTTLRAYIDNSRTDESAFAETGFEVR